MPSPRKTGGGAFDPSDRHVYFIAGSVDRVMYGARSHEYLLVAVNEVNSETEMVKVDAWIADGKRVFLDSGIYSLAMEHALAHGLSHDQGLNMPPDQVDGFPELLARYRALVARWGDGLWGYIELDLGGRENKIKTRAMLEDLGLAPIPVYHPFGDGWDYFDELAQGYDRICLGNIVQADRTTRLKLLATLIERKRAYPELWVHGLGMTPNEILNAYPLDSCDSSAWLNSVRWSGYTERAGGASLGHLPRDFQYVLKSDPASDLGSRKACEMSAYGSYCTMLNWRAALTDQRDVQP